MGSATTIHFTFPSTLAAAADAQHRIMKEVESMGYPEDAKFAIHLALDEALTNAVRHGNGLKPELHVDVSYTLTHESFTICVSDQGKGFKPEQVPDPTLDENLDRPSGRGIMLMKAYMTEVHFSTRGNTVTLVKRRDCKLPRSE